MGRKYEYATTTATSDATKVAQLVPAQPRGDGWEMCGSSAMQGATRLEHVEDDEGDYTFRYATVRVLWFWKREVSK